MISVIVPTYNGEKYIFEAVNSILEQDFKNFEIIIVDDGSTDKCNWFFFKDNPKIRIFHQEHKGISAALNLGISKAKGEWITIFGADDIMLPGTLKYFSKITDKTKIHITDCELIDADGKITGKTIRKKIPYNKQRDAIQDRMIGGGGSNLIHKSVIQKVGPFNEALPYGEDYDYWLRAILLHKIYIKFHHIISNQYRIHDGQITKQQGMAVVGLLHNIRKGVQNENT